MKPLTGMQSFHINYLILTVHCINLKKNTSCLTSKCHVTIIYMRSVVTWVSESTSLGLFYIVVLNRRIKSSCHCNELRSGKANVKKWRLQRQAMTWTQDINIAKIELSITCTSGKNKTLQGDKNCYEGINTYNKCNK